MKEDLVARALLAAGHDTRFLDSALDGIPYFYARLYPEGAWAERCEWDFGDATGRYLDAIALCQQMAGLGFESEGSTRLKEALIGMFSEEDGLCYRSRGLDWVEFGANMFDPRSALLAPLRRRQSSEPGLPALPHPAGIRLSAHRYRSGLRDPLTIKRSGS